MSCTSTLALVFSVMCGTQTQAADYIPGSWEARGYGATPGTPDGIDGHQHYRARGVTSRVFGRLAVVTNEKTRNAPINRGSESLPGTSVPGDTATDGGSVVAVSGPSARRSASSANSRPDPPMLVVPSDGACVAAPDAQLTVRVRDPDSDKLQVTFYGRVVYHSPGSEFTVVALPDTQYYSQSFPEIFTDQTQWIVDNREARGIVYVSHLGDIVEFGNEIAHWENADASLSVLDMLPDLPYGLCVGNHDQYPDGTMNFNAFFPFTRYQNRPWYGGHYGSDNDNHFALFTAGEMEFVAIHLEYDPSANPDVLAWVGTVLEAHADRHAIVAAHYLIDRGEQAAWGDQGAATYAALKGYPNLFLMLCGHKWGEGRRSDTYGNNTVWTLMSDYQGRDNGGNGWLRIMKFIPPDNEIHVQTYSPTLDEYEDDADSQFALAYDMAGPPFVELGRLSDVSSESNVSFFWPDVKPNETYHWYATVSDGSMSNWGSVWSFYMPELGDGDCDGDVDLVDFREWRRCLAGPRATPRGLLLYSDPGCAIFDSDSDGDVDLADFWSFQTSFTGQL